MSQNTSDDTDEAESEPKTVTAYPSKDTYEAVGADVDARTGAGELVDNAIDNAALISNHADPITVEFDHRTLDDGTEELVIRDDSGGINPDELGVVIGLGQSKKGSATSQQVGAFGIGAKKALKAFGDEFVITSRYYRSEQGYGYQVPSEWFEDDEAWEFELEETDLEAGVTELRVRDLNIDWENQVEDIREWLADTYQLYLGVGPSDVKLDLTLKVDGETVEPPEPVPWAFSPWDGLHPRQHSGFKFDSRELNAPVEMQITVGIMRGGEGDEAGTDIFCQDRLVEKANKDKSGGYGAPDGLPTFTTHMYRRFKIQLEFWTTEGGSAKDLPWNSDKSRIRESHPVMIQAYEWIRKATRRYMRAAQYGAKGVDEAFLKHYDEDSELAVEMEHIDFSSRWEKQMNGETIRVTDKPENGFPQVTKMEETAEAHAKLGVSCENVGWFEDWMLPTYRDLVNQEFEELSENDFDSVTDEDISLETLTTISAAPPDFTSGSRQVDEEVNRLISSAKAHLRRDPPVRYTGIDEWERPWYTAAFETFADSREIDIDSVEETDEFPDVDIDHSTDHLTDEAALDSGQDGSGSQRGSQSQLGPGSSDETSDEGDGQDGSTTGTHGTDGLDAGEADLVFAGWTEEDLELVAREFEDLSSMTPEERKELLVNLAAAVESGQLRFNPMA